MRKAPIKVRNRVQIRPKSVRNWAKIHPKSERGVLGGLWGVPGSVLGAFWRALGPARGGPGPVRGGFGGRPGGVPGPFWGALGGPGASLGVTGWSKRGLGGLLGDGGRFPSFQPAFRNQICPSRPRIERPLEAKNKHFVWEWCRFPHFPALAGECLLGARLGAFRSPSGALSGSPSAPLDPSWPPGAGARGPI